MYGLKNAVIFFFYLFVTAEHFYDAFLIYLKRTARKRRTKQSISKLMYSVREMYFVYMISDE